MEVSILNRMLFALVALALGFAALPAAAQTDANPNSNRPPQQVSADLNYVFDGHNSLRATMKQIYNRKDGGSIYFGEDIGFFHSTCGGAAFCNNIGGNDTDLRLGLQVAQPDIFLALSDGNFKGNGGSMTGLGIGFEKLARGEHPFEVTASLFYYPSAVGTYVCPTVTPCYITPSSAQLDFRVTRYALGGHYALSTSPFYLNFGIAGDNGSPSVAGNLTPQSFTHNGAYLGLGLKL